MPNRYSRHAAVALLLLETSSHALDGDPFAHYGFDAPHHSAPTDGVDGQALRLRGDGARALPAALDPERNFTVMFWVRTTAADDERFVLVSQKDAFTDNSLDSQKRKGWAFLASDGTWAWNLGSGDRRIRYERENGEHMPLNDGRWHQLVMTHDADARLMHLYFDGRRAATYNVHDASGFDLSNDAPVTLGAAASDTSDLLPSIAAGATQLQALVDTFATLDTAPIRQDELVQLVIDPEALLSSRDIDDEAHLERLTQVTRQLMRNPYTIHQSADFMQVAPLLKLYRVADGRITIDPDVEAQYAARERLDAPDFDLDELSIWDRTLTRDEVAAAYARHFPSTSEPLAERIDTLTAAAWNIHNGGIHDTVEEDGWDSRDVIVELIRRERIDIVMMQETYSAGDFISAALGFHFATTVDWDYLNQGSNISVLSRYPIEAVLVPPGSPFNNVAALVRVSETQRVWAMSNWYGMRNFSDVYEFHRERLDDADRIPVLFAGDFNAIPHADGGSGSEASHALEAAGFIDAFRDQYPDARTHPGPTHERGKRIDQLYFKGDSLEHVSTEVISEWPTLFPADHFLITSVFELR